MNKVFLIEDETDLLSVLVELFASRDIQAKPFSSVEACEEYLRTNPDDKPDCFVVDWMLPGKNGVEFVKDFRQKDKLTPVFILTANTRSDQIQTGLLTGADDYITKPFNPDEFMIRVKNAMAKYHVIKKMPSASLATNDVVFDKENGVIVYKGDIVSLTTCEQDILMMLHQSRGNVVKRNDLFAKIDDGSGEISPRNVDVHMANLRKKLGHTDLVIDTIRGQGYKLL